jgi:hypothetical protein
MAETCREPLCIAVPQALSAREALEQENGAAALGIQN